MIEDHREGSKHNSLLKAAPEDDSDSAWMVSYIDIMTLLVALFVIIIVAAESANPGWLTHESLPDAEPEYQQPLELGVPLPDALDARRRKPLRAPDELWPASVTVAMGVAGLPKRIPAPPVLLARPGEEADPPPPLHDGLLLPALLPADVSEPKAPQLPEVMLAGADDPSAPVADYLVVLTDHPPVNAEPLSSEALESARALSDALPQRQQEAPYLPDLDGVEASRVSEGINLRVQNKLLFDSAEADLSDSGVAVAASLVDTIERYDGEVSVEGHSDSRSINTEAYPSNWALSSARAIAIVQALEEAGVDPERLRAVGLAATRPLADNDTAKGRARNRRVEVVIHLE
ncbi:OmpA family protein [Vreelandella jeotgali]|uniref:OmpA family protein n=1 Tax=Vreelandella jeotgali TaxID=553386 RepID=UPI00034631B7|nr:OmpA family protein [Halomonas jeotgali]